ncbi:MAG: MaoC family dehydratase [Dehalococcoidia bacterium]|nr:MAG: MaoC family dehydratase [Dehalococcoidia bacterium]
MSQEAIDKERWVVGAELPSLAKTLSQEKIDRYARASGDFNPIHVDPAFAAQTPFGGTIAHGMLLLAYLSEVLTAAFGQAWLSDGRLKVRFKGAARSEDAVTVGGHIQRVQEGHEERRLWCDVGCLNQQGEVLVAGQAEVKL